MPKRKDLNYPMPSSMDDARKVTVEVAGASLEAVSGVPVVGSLLKAVLEQVIPDGLEKRREDWAKRVIEAVETFGDKLEETVKSDEFISLYFRASEQARRNHQTEKLDALGAALKNAGSDLDFDFKELFVQFLGDMTVLELKFFTELAIEVKLQEEQRRRSQKHIEDFANEHFSGERGRAKWITDRLEQWNLIEYAPPGAVPYKYMRVTWLGRRFCKFFSLRGRAH